jgi:hypothetical protein
VVSALVSNVSAIVFYDGLEKIFEKAYGINCIFQLCGTLWGCFFMLIYGQMYWNPEHCSLAHILVICHYDREGYGGYNAIVKARE